MEILKDEKGADIIYFVKKGNSLSSIADHFCVSLSELKKDNNIIDGQEVEEGDILWIKKANTFCHIVKPAETLASIAKQYRVSEQYIKEVNNIEKIFIGQKIFI